MKSKDLFKCSSPENNVPSNSQFFKTYEETKDWLDWVGIMDYDINMDTLVVDVDGHVWLSIEELKRIPVKFGDIEGGFSVGNCKKLESLIGCPNSSRIMNCYLTGIKNFNGLGNVKNVVAYSIESLESFEGLPNELDHLSIDGSCHNVKSLDHFPKIINDALLVCHDFKWFDSLYRHMELCNEIILDGEIKDYGNILKLLYVKGLNTVSVINHLQREDFDILNSEIKRQPDPRKRNLLKVAQELSNAGFHHLTV